MDNFEKLLAAYFEETFSFFEVKIIDYSEDVSCSYHVKFDQVHMDESTTRHDKVIQGRDLFGFMWSQQNENNI